MDKNKFFEAYLDRLKYSPYVGPQGKSFKLEIKLHGATYPPVFFGYYLDVCAGCICPQMFFARSQSGFL